MVGVTSLILFEASGVGSGDRSYFTDEERGLGECPAQNLTGVTSQSRDLNEACWAPVPLASLFSTEGTLLTLDEEAASSPGPPC